MERSSATRGPAGFWSGIFLPTPQPAKSPEASGARARQQRRASTNEHRARHRERASGLVVTEFTARYQTALFAKSSGLRQRGLVGDLRSRLLRFAHPVNGAPLLSQSTIFVSFLCVLRSSKLSGSASIAAVQISRSSSNSFLYEIAVSRASFCSVITGPLI